MSPRILGAHSTVRRLRAAADYRYHRRYLPPMRLPGGFFTR